MSCYTLQSISNYIINHNLLNGNFDCEDIVKQIKHHSHFNDILIRLYVREQFKSMGLKCNLTRMNLP